MEFKIMIWTTAVQDFKLLKQKLIQRKRMVTMPFLCREESNSFCSLQWTKEILSLVKMKTAGAMLPWLMLSEKSKSFGPKYGMLLSSGKNDS
jgi:hypothetical protein